MSAASGRLGGRAGVILPAALFILLAGTLLGASLLATARVSLILSDGDRRLAEALARRPLSPEGLAGALEEGGEAVAVHALGDGFHLVEEPVEGVGWRLWSVGWVPGMARLAAELSAAAVTGEGLEVDGGDLLAGGPAEGCAGTDPLDPFALHRRRSAPLPPFPEPSLPGRPRLGPVSLEALLERADPVLLPGAELPGGWAGWGDDGGRALVGATGPAGPGGASGARPDRGGRGWRSPRVGRGPRARGRGPLRGTRPGPGHPRPA